MRIHDITVPLSTELPTYPGDPSLVFNQWNSISKGDSSNLTQITLSSHSGTHIDAPRHFIDGAGSVDELPLGVLIGRARLVDLAGVKEIGRRELERVHIKGVERLLLKTDNSKLWGTSCFHEHFAAVTAEGAHYLRECGVKLVGIDYLSIEPFHGDGDVHRTLLGSGVVVLEGINLTGVLPGEYELICLPLRIAGGDGAPVRAVLRGGWEGDEESGFDPHTTKWPLA